MIDLFKVENKIVHKPDVPAWSSPDVTDVANPEVLLFASTTQSFLEKEAPLSRLRELHAQARPSRPTGGGGPPSWAGPVCWCRRNSAAEAFRATGYRTWR